MLLVGLLEEHPRLPQIIEAMNGCADLFTCEAASTFVLVLSINPPRAAAVSRKSPWLTTLRSDRRLHFLNRSLYARASQRPSVNTQSSPLCLPGVGTPLNDAACDRSIERTIP
eukprot:scaffold358_cov343-Pavlova_lutheri.AAC.51